MRRSPISVVVLTFFATLAFALLPVSSARSQQTQLVSVLDVRGAIGVGTTYLIEKALADAQRRQARLMIIRLDTPGGLVSATRDIIQAILASSIPVAVYVAPSGARAASAGTYIAYAAQFAAMAPGTHIGAATPIQLGVPAAPAPTGKDSPKEGKGSAMERKIVNDAVSYIRSLAQLRGRNADWAEKAVRDAATLTATEAAKDNVVDVIASDLGDLLAKLDGRMYRTTDGEQRLNVKAALLETIEPGWRTRFIEAITDPNIAFILLMVGFYGLIIEFWSPGLTAPGVIGGVSLIVALSALSTLPISIGGMALLALGAGLMIAEATAPGFGILGLGGAVAFALGGLFLFDPAGSDVDFGVAWPVVISATATSGLILIGLLGYVMRSRQAKVVTGAEEMIGLVGRVVSWSADAGTEGQGRVALHGETWSARAASSLAPGQKVSVVSRQGLVLTVAPVEERS